MSTVSLLWVEVEAFKSFKAKTRIELSTGAGLKYLGGDNKARPRLGANGVGKSSLWDAVIWCWYGRGARGQKASELTTRGSKRPIVSTMIRIGTANTLISRSGSPDKLLVDGEATEQYQLEELLGLSRTRFQHSVLFGQQVQLFPDLSMPQRAELLDEVCDLQLWQRASTEVSDALSDFNSELATAMRAVANAQGQLTAIAATDMEELESRADQWEDQREEDVAQAKKQVKLAKLEYYAAAELAAKHLPSVVDVSVYDSRISTGRDFISQRTADIKVAQHTLTLNNKEIDFYENHSECPTCKQSISLKLNRDRRKELQEENEELLEKIEQHQKKLVQYRNTLAVLVRERDEVIAANQEQISRHNYAKGAAKQKQEILSRSEASLASLLVEAENPYRRQILSLTQQRKNADRTLSKALMQQNKVNGKIAELDYWKTGFKKVRLYLINRVLDYLTIETEAAAQALGLGGWEIKFVTEVETKSGTTKQGVQILVSDGKDSGTWESWSGGEGQRLRLAIALGLASLIQQMAGVDYTWEVYDEPSNWLSAEGIDDLLECLKGRADTLRKSIWLVDHRALSATSFDELWIATKKRSGTEIKQVS